MPEEVRPARPARWVADALETGTVEREERDVVGLYVRICRQRSQIYHKFDTVDGDASLLSPVKHPRKIQMWDVLLLYSWK